MLSPTIGRWIETPTGTLSLAAIPLAFALFKILQKPRRLSKVSKTKERVLVLGATSGIGRSIARQYAERGAVVCIVGRRGALVDEVVKECRQARSSLRLGTSDEKIDFLGVTADFANVDDMVRVREVIQSSVCQSLFFFLPGSIRPVVRLEWFRYYRCSCWGLGASASDGRRWRRNCRWRIYSRRSKSRGDQASY